MSLHVAAAIHCRVGEARRRHPCARARRCHHHACSRGGGAAAAATRGGGAVQEGGVGARRLLRLDAARRQARHARLHGRVHRLLLQGLRDPDGRAQRARPPRRRDLQVFG